MSHVNIRNSGSLLQSARLRILSAVITIPMVIWFGNPAIAMLAGCALTLLWDQKPLALPANTGTWLLQGAIVLLGLGISLNILWDLSNTYIGIVSAIVLGILAIGLVLGRLVGTPRDGATLISSGTAICGGTAIATLSGVIRASPEQTGICLAVVFLLNALALFSFPFIGEHLGLTQQQFGIWAALAIHDTSSVVATAAIFGDEAAEVATTLKLMRTLWLIPVVFVAALLRQADSARLRIPAFVLLFIAAATLGTLVELPPALLLVAKTMSGIMLVLALFLIGTEITRRTLTDLRGKEVVMAVLLWAIVVPVVLLLSVWLG